MYCRHDSQLALSDLCFVNAHNMQLSFYLSCFNMITPMQGKSVNPQYPFFAIIYVHSLSQIQSATALINWTHCLLAMRQRCVECRRSPAAREAAPKAASRSVRFRAGSGTDVPFAGCHRSALPAIRIRSCSKRTDQAPIVRTSPRRSRRERRS